MEYANVWHDRIGGTDMQKFTLAELPQELLDVIDIARDIIKNIDNVPDDVANKLKLVIINLDAAKKYAVRIYNEMK